MSGRRPSDLFCEEHANFWTLIQQIIHALRNSYPVNQDETIGRMGQLNLQLSTLGRAGEMMGLSYPPSDIVRDAPSQFFSARAQRHQNYYGTEFGYACWYTQAQLSYAIADLLHHRDHTRVADQLETLLVGWQLTEMRAFPRQLPIRNPVEQPASIVYMEGPPYYTPGGPEPRMKTAGAAIGRLRHPRVYIAMQAPTDTLYGVARQTRHRAAPYPEPGARPRRRGNARLTPTMPQMALPLPHIMQNGDASHTPVPKLPGVQSLFTPLALPGGRTLPGAPSTSGPPPPGMQFPSKEAAPRTGDAISLLNSNIAETLNREELREELGGRRGPR
ncbi:hypothetical protein N7489_003074 [Penicillium chrysogenum]|uniref:uncharacterized protein n=1 Tax=Penicillium chrysogenum TaxID=5076 RepID=UPI00239ABAFE|nr:uncharacterized protein N7489_003074 [Penicillium chrysogenum]KAJ5252664.1 hypothetical protein N7489_003074 [Penicillium chrysogenum]KAJ5254183.1 hypothetical protein N7524_011363 [Penicillium chrysogenum]